MSDTETDKTPSIAERKIELEECLAAEYIRNGGNQSGALRL